MKTPTLRRGYTWIRWDDQARVLDSRHGIGGEMTRDLRTGKWKIPRVKISAMNIPFAVAQKHAAGISSVAATFQKLWAKAIRENDAHGVGENKGAAQ
jgi:hypothetical protein